VKQNEITGPIALNSNGSAGGPISAAGGGSGVAVVPGSSTHDNTATQAPIVTQP